MKKIILALACTVVSMGLVPPVAALAQGEQVVLPFPIVDPPTKEELELAPLLDLRNGGISTGAAQGTGPTQGGLINGTLLPQTGDSFRASSSEKSRWGSGMMVSMIMNSAPLLALQYTGVTLRIGGIAQQTGGPYKPHKSHQNGLDADILFVGTDSYDSVLDSTGAVTERFDPEKNWAYWRMITAQKILVKGKPISAISMILVDPRIKTFLEARVVEDSIPMDELDLQVMKLLRPTEGHDTHFHVRLRCSPHYTTCLER
ncbi:MAG: hypothetical protein EOP05_06650 [Proteobacteria bacterium]|nr:MAG: hypothetical protein EOP05_06650 [Pseudomonadota bacterium]